MLDAGSVLDIIPSNVRLNQAGRARERAREHRWRSSRAAPDRAPQLHRLEMPAAAAVPKLPLTVTGPARAPVLLFVHGWPDDESLFEAQASHFSADYRVARVRLPWFSARAAAARDGAARGYDRWGYDFDALADAVAATARELGAGKGGKRVTLVGHDWGAVIVLLAEISHPGLFLQVVALDVSLFRWMISGPSGRRAEVLAMLYAGLLYMFAVIASFLFAHSPGLAGAGDAAATHMARRMCRAGLWRRPGSQAADAAASPASAGTHALSGYPYFYLWRAYVRGLFGYRVSARRAAIARDTARLRADATAYPVCPVLFMYGGDKPLALHDGRWEASVAARTDGSRVARFDRCGHWLLKEEPAAVNRVLEEWLRGARPN